VEQEQRRAPRAAPVEQVEREPVHGQAAVHRPEEIRHEPDSRGAAAIGGIE
jgi:hypothetical protein